MAAAGAAAAASAQQSSQSAAKARQGRVLAMRRPSSSWILVLGMLLTLSLVILILLSLGMASIPVHSDSPRMQSADHVHIELPSERDGLGERGRQWTEVLSWEPRAFLYHNFLSKEECEYIIGLAQPKMKRSTVVDGATGKSKDSSVRTSSGMFLERGGDRIVKAIEKRIADFTFIPPEHGEGLQVLHYEVEQKYEPHFDYFADEVNTKNGGQRMATMLMYLSDVEEGGETVFPNAKANSSSLPYYNELSECGKKGLAVKPRMGDAVLFWSMKPDGTLDPRSLHGACPVIKGSKWSSPKWLRVREYTV